MKIVCWNMQGRHVDSMGDPKHIVAVLMTLTGADVLIVLEPQRGLCNGLKVSGRGGIDGVTCKTVPARRLTKSGVKYENVFVASKLGFTLDVFTPKGQTNDAVLITIGATRIVTAHAPYGDGRSAEASQFLDALLKWAAVQNVMPDLIMGDLNTYGTSDKGTAQKSGYGLQLRSPTSNHGCGGPLDKVYVRQGIDQFRCGRVYSNTQRVDPLHPDDRASGRVEDIRLPFPLLDRADHIAIHASLGGDGAAASASASFSESSSGAPRGCDIWAWLYRTLCGGLTASNDGDDSDDESDEASAGAVAPGRTRSKSPARRR